MKYCDLCGEPVIFVLIIGWQHVTLSGIDHDVRLRR